MSNLTGEVIKRMVRPQISKVNIAVTWKCNQRCKSCNIWQTYQGNVDSIKEELRGINRPASFIIDKIVKTHFRAMLSHKKS